MQADETGRPRKRQRTSDKAARPLERDAEFWFEDGTVILIASNVEFRVYRGLLSKHSPVFRGLLALPRSSISRATPSPSSSTRANASPVCPIVHVTDSATELRHILRVFVPDETLEYVLHFQLPLTAITISLPLSPGYSPWSSELTFHVVSAWLRLGHKYQIPALVEGALRHLRRFYPSSLCGQSDGCPGPIKKDRPADVRGPHAIGIANLARLTGSHDLLPLALLECCKLGTKITKGYTRKDGTVELLNEDDL